MRRHGVIGIGTNSQAMANALLQKPKLYSVLAGGPRLVVADADKLTDKYKHQVVMRDWLSVAKRFGPILVDTEAPLTKDQKYFMEWQ